MAVAIANSKEEAIQILANKEKTKAVYERGFGEDDIDPSQFNNASCEERELDDPCGYFVYGGG